MESYQSKSAGGNCRIAVIGLGCYYPGAKTTLQLWENILARRQQFREMPEVRLPNSEYFDPDPQVPDKTYQNKASVLDGYHFDWLNKRIPKKTFESTDIVHWLALDTALQALADSGYTKENIPGEKTGVVLGNTLTGEFTRSNQMMLRWPYVKKALRKALNQRGLSHLAGDLESTMEKYYKSVFAPVTEDTLAGGLANTIAGRICNFLDIHGGGFIVDGACSSSLIAITLAANYLESKQMDMVIAGGVDISLDTFELVGFAKTGALTSDEMRVYDKEGKGFIPGEGCGMVVLKRLEDAERDNDQIYAIINGWGISSDGKGGITAPSASGQSMALLRAYEKAGIDPADLDFIEGHGTGTTVGDKVELEGITIALTKSENIRQRSCGVTSFKSIVGHTKAAAGVGAFIKTVMAVNRRVLPPTAGLKEYNPVFDNKAQVLYPILHGEVKNPGTIINAGVSAMGFGGINSHVVIQSGQPPFSKLQPQVDERKLFYSNQTHELLLFSSDTKNNLAEEIRNAHTEALGISYGELADYAFYRNTQKNISGIYRAAVIAATPTELAVKLESLSAKVENWKNEKILSFENSTVLLGKKLNVLKIGAMFPGQGSQKLNMTAKITERHTWLKDIVIRAGEIFKTQDSDDILSSMFMPTDKAVTRQQIIDWQNNLKQTNFAQPAITLASLIWLKYLQKIGIKISATTGHSLGELMAFFTAGLLDEETLLRFASFRGKSMAAYGSGSMASLVCSREKTETYLKEAPGYVTIANINAPEQTVISGDPESIKYIIVQAERDHISAVELPVSAAFHSNLVADVSDRIRNYEALNKKGEKNNEISLISSVTGEEVDPSVDLNGYFAEQAVRQVNFIKAVENIAGQCDLLVEIGPGKVLSGLVSQVTDKIQAFPVEVKADDDFSLNVFLGNAFVRGADIITEELYKNRLVREFVPASRKEFLVNPLERPFPAELNSELRSEPAGLNEFSFLNSVVGDPGFDDYLKVRGNFIRDVISSDRKYFLNESEKPDKHRIKQFDSVEKEPVTYVEKNQPIKKTGVQEIVWKKIALITGFVADNFRSEMKLLDDFNLDSIKAGALLADLAKTFNLNGKLNNSELSNASLADLVSRIQSLTDGQKIPGQLEPVGETIAQVVLNKVSQKTGFPVEQLSPELRLLNDLNLDSIKAGALMVELIKQYHLQGKIEAQTFANATLKEIISKISSFVLPVETREINSSVSREEVEQHVLTMLSEKTGFPRESIKTEFKLLDDLNLDSIKAGTFISGLSKAFNLQGKFENARFSNARVSEIINMIGDMVAGDIAMKAITGAGKNESDWVNAYSVEFEDAPLDENMSNRAVFTEGETSIVVYADEEKAQAEKIRLQINALLPDISIIDQASIQLIKGGPKDNLIVLLPGGTINEQNVLSTAELFANVAKYNNQQGTLTFLQFNGGMFQREKDKKNKQTGGFSAISFAASIHHERPDMKLRVLDFDKSYAEKHLPEILSRELASDKKFDLAGYDEKGIRRRMIYSVLDLQNGQPEYITFGRNDVLLASGGAKGITAECAFAFAEKYNSKTALVGSSKENDEINLTLKRFKDKGLEVKYYSCDISDKKLLQETIKSIQHELGGITVVLHGAGKNIPRRAEQVDYKAAVEEIRPKLIGAINLVDALQDEPLKYFVALSSIIGITGMPGNSWYAFSNETLDIFLRSVRRNTRIKTRTYAYSVWNEVGMGARMGSVHTLAGMGIGSISPSQGITEFLKWLNFDDIDQQVAVTSRMGGLDTWYRKQPVKPEANRYLKEIKYFEPGKELAARVKLNTQKDLYLQDHNYNGSLLFPTVFGLEAMTQAAVMVSGFTGFSSITLENISLQKPIVVPFDGETEIEINAVIIDNSNPDNVRIHAGISTELTDFGEHNFSAEILLSKTAKAPGHTLDILGKSLNIQPKIDLYNWLLFQGPRFRNISEIYELTSGMVKFRTITIEKDPSDECFDTQVKSGFILGSPLVRDVLLQSVQLYLTQKKYLPVYIKKWTIYNVEKQKAGGFVHSTLQSLDDEKGSCEVVFSNNQEILEKIEGYTVKALEPTPNYPVAEEIADLQSYFSKIMSDEWQKYENLFAEKIDFRIYKHPVEFNLLKREERHAIEKKLFRNYLNVVPDDSRRKDKMIAWKSNGKPYIENSDWDISYSHSRALLFMTVGRQEQGCDMEFVESRDESVWKEMLDNKFGNIPVMLQSVDQDVNLSYTRLWCAKEAVIKSKGSMPLGMNIEKISGNGVIFKVNTGQQNYLKVMTFPVELMPGVFVMLAVRMEPAIDHTPEKTGVKNDLMEPGASYDRRSNKFSHQFCTTFKDCRGFYGKTYFTDFPVWMGSLRELVLMPVKTELLRDLGSGDYGMVTNTSHIHIYNETETLNNITGNLWITDKSDFENSYIDLKFEFLKHLPDTGQLIKLADCNLATTWVKIAGRGVVKKSPIPDYFMTFLKRYLVRGIDANINGLFSDYPGLKNLGNEEYTSPVVPRPNILLNNKVFQTGLSNGNTVGNLYYSNYYEWQAILIEQYFFSLVPEVMLGNGNKGEFITVESKVNHLQEAMPFENIETCMYLEKVYEHGLILYFEYFADEGEMKRKLAYGSNTLLWAKRPDEKALPQVEKIPQKLYAALGSLLLV